MNVSGIGFRSAAAVAAACASLALASAAAAVPGAIQGAAPGPSGRFSMEVWKRPLQLVAEQLARKGGVDVLIPAAAGNLEVSAALIDVDVRGALQRLLAHHSYMLVERDDGRFRVHGRRVIEVMLLGAASGGRDTTAAAPIRAVAQEDRSVDELVQVALMGASGRERARAVDAIAYREQPDEGSASRTESVMLSALIDPAHEVRAQALATLKDTADEIPFEALSQVAREDERAAIRIQALELLAERGEERALEPLRIALLDPEDAVRTRARELIGEWHLDTSGSGGT